MSCLCIPFTICVFIVGAIFPPVGEISDSCIEGSRGNVGREGGIVEDAWFESSIGIGMSQHAEGVILVPSSILVKFFEFRQIFSEVSHFLVGIAEALNLSS